MEGLRSSDQGSDGGELQGFGIVDSEQNGDGNDRTELLFPTLFYEWTGTLKRMDTFCHKENLASQYWGQYCFTLEIQIYTIGWKGFCALWMQRLEILCNLNINNSLLWSGCVLKSIMKTVPSDEKLLDWQIIFQNEKTLCK